MILLEPFSTLESVERRANEERITLWTNFNGNVPDPDVLDQGFQEASGIIFEYLVPRFGASTLGTWTLDTAPPRILRISDVLSIYVFSSRDFSQNPLLETLYTNTITSLEGIAEGKRGLYDVSEGVIGKIQTALPCRTRYSGRFCPDPVFGYALPWGCQ